MAKLYYVECYSPAGSAPMWRFRSKITGAAGEPSITYPPAQKEGAFHQDALLAIYPQLKALLKEGE